MAHAYKPPQYHHHPNNVNKRKAIILVAFIVCNRVSTLKCVCIYDGDDHNDDDPQMEEMRHISIEWKLNIYAFNTNSNTNRNGSHAFIFIFYLFRAVQTGCFGKLFKFRWRDISCTHFIIFIILFMCIYLGGRVGLEWCHALVCGCGMCDDHTVCILVRQILLLRDMQ